MFCAPAPVDGYFTPAPAPEDVYVAPVSAVIAAPAPVGDHTSRVPVVIAVPAGFCVWCTMSDACSLSSQGSPHAKRAALLLARSRQRGTNAELTMKAAPTAPASASAHLAHKTFVGSRHVRWIRLIEPADFVFMTETEKLWTSWPSLCTPTMRSS